MMGRSNAGTDAFSGGSSDEQPEHEVVLGSFYLDKYEVTVARFRKFVESGSGVPASGAGLHPNIDGTGWNADWDAHIPTTTSEWEDIISCGSKATWTAGEELLPINCVNWYQAFAFCIWDGGRLPTEAEWEYVAAAGDENRLYPWGQDDATCELANYYGCLGGPAPVGSTTGIGRWGHHDLAGNLYEWVFDVPQSDWYSDDAASGANPCNVGSATSTVRELRGGQYNYPDSDLRAAARYSTSATFAREYIGFRCARDR